MSAPAATETPRTAPGRLASVDLLRGAAALAVVLFHAVLYADVPKDSPGILRALVAVCSQGYLGVPLFFVISGFCIHLGWAARFRRTGETKMDWFGFWRRRMRRLYPAYFGALVIAMALVVAAYFLRPNQAIVTQYPQPRLQWMGLDFLSHALMLHGLIPMFDGTGGNPAFWSLAREEYLYAMYAALLVFRRRRGVLVALAIVAAVSLAFQSVAYLLQAPPLVANTLYTSAISLWIQWALGLVAAEAYVGNCRIPRVFASLWMVPAFWTLATLSREWVPVLTATLWGVTFFTLLNAVVQRESAHRWPRNRWSDWLARVGVFSYSLYLVHVPARTVVKYALLYAGADVSRPLVYALSVLVIVPAGYYSARLYFWLVEERCLTQPSAAVPARAKAALATD